MSKNQDEKVVVAKMEPLPGDVPTIVLGVPRDAWDYMQNGETHTFDLRAAGIPLQIVMFGADSHKAVIQSMDQVSIAVTGAPMENKPTPGNPLADIGIKDPTVQ